MRSTVWFRTVRQQPFFSRAQVSLHLGALDVILCRLTQRNLPILVVDDEVHGIAEITIWQALQLLALGHTLNHVIRCTLRLLTWPTELDVFPRGGQSTSCGNCVHRLHSRRFDRLCPSNLFPPVCADQQAAPSTIQCFHGTVSDPSLASTRQASPATMGHAFQRVAYRRNADWSYTLRQTA